MFARVCREIDQLVFGAQIVDTATLKLASSAARERPYRADRGPKAGQRTPMQLDQSRVSTEPFLVSPEVGRVMILRRIFGKLETHRQQTDIDPSLFAIAILFPMS